MVLVIWQAENDRVFWTKYLTIFNENHIVSQMERHDDIYVFYSGGPIIVADIQDLHLFGFSRIPP
jgi:hypothetical protein